MSNRRGFLKKALVLMAGATIVTPALTRAIKHVQKYHPEVQAVFDRMPNDLLFTEKRAIAKFILAEIESGNWDAIEQFYINVDPLIGINLKG